MQRTHFPAAAHAGRQAGLTLIELLVSVAVLGVLVAIAVPSMAGLMRQWAMDASAETFAGDLRLARSTATRLYRPVTVCPHANGNDCTQTTWESGWMVFVDLDNDQRLDANETVILRRGAQAGIAVINGKLTSVHSFDFRPNGTLSGGANTIRVAAGAQGGDHREVVVNMMGRVHVQPVQ